MNILESLDRGFRRPKKAQSSFSAEESALTLLFAMVAFAETWPRRIAGIEHLKSLAMFASATSA
ncbi:MAG: hypothetical protein D6718_05045 [Acidobacteria bacterium]|nr:MAG: hypothetical protein D6718_05045 [Acidobacteriota bacterium]